MSWITVEEAFSRLENIGNTKEEFVSLLEQISIESSGDKTILYSGLKSDSEKALMKTLIDNSDYRMIDKTETTKISK